MEIYFSNLSGRSAPIPDDSRPPTYNSLFGRRSSISGEQVNTNVQSLQRAQSMNDESRKTKRKTRCYIICAVILIIVSIAAIEVVYQVHFKYKDDSNLPFPSPEPFTGSWGRQFIVLFMKNAINTTNTLYVTSVHGVKMNATTSERLNNSIKALVDRSVFTSSAENFSISSSMELESFKKETKCISIETSGDAMIFSQTVR